MDSNRARMLYHQNASALAYIDVLKPDGNRGIGSAFHIGEGVFVTARHVLEENEIIEIKATEPVGVSSTEYIREIMKVDVTDEFIKQYDETLSNVMGSVPLFKHYIEPLELINGPFFSDNKEIDVAVFKVKKIHPATAIVKLGIHWDDWVYRKIWHLSDAILLGYPPIPMANEPLLVAARAEIHTFFVPRHAPAVHFILSAVPRGGFSGGVAIHESGDALGVITSSFVQNSEPEQLGFFSVLSIEAIVKCLEKHKLYPEIQKEHHDKVLGIEKKQY
ncbi:MAG TPA: hypothetical protein DDW65_03275 [Firmicutes bacterium]|jgi:hypothetical protein|nr:hypothetical protein [Bacillota bacterium]